MLKLHHVCIFAHDIEHSVRFYTAAFGCRMSLDWSETVSEDGRRFPGRGVFLRARDDTLIEIFKADDTDALEFPTRAINHLCFATQDCNADFKRAVAAGAVPYLPRRARDLGIAWDGSPVTMDLNGNVSTRIRIAYLKGPDGEIIELLEGDLPE
jgi:catechol 2,3-dioxygenase-like lactoylglutathione lyase family enzyme